VVHDDLLAFARRDWPAIGRSRLTFWADRYRREQGAAAQRASAQLFEHAQRIGSELLDERHRSCDYQHHLRLRDLLDRAACAFTGR
jgi:hypothetical protein